MTCFKIIAFKDALYKVRGYMYNTLYNKRSTFPYPERETNRKVAYKYLVIAKSIDKVQ